MLVYFFFFMILLVTRSWLLNVAVIAISLMVPVQVADCFAFFYAGGLAAMARQAVTSSSSRAAGAAGWPPSSCFCYAPGSPRMAI